MRSAEALSVLQGTAIPFFSTGEVAEWLDVSLSSASRLLSGLADLNLISKVRNGQWGIDPASRPLALASWITSPYPSYVSLYTALYNHEMITQIPQEIYVVSLDRPQSISTSFGHFSVHQIAPEIFGGFESVAGGIKQATPEKALFDAIYLGHRGAAFSNLPEIDLPSGFDPAIVLDWVERIPDPAVRTRTMKAARGTLARLQ